MRNFLFYGAPVVIVLGILLLIIDAIFMRVWLWALVGGGLWLAGYLMWRVAIPNSELNKGRAVISKDVER